MTDDPTTRLAEMADRLEIQELVRRERFARDQRHWDVMRECFHPDARIRTSWYDGTAEDYIPATQRLMETSPHGKHWVLSGYVTINGDRATVESPASIFNRLHLNEVEVDYFVYCRFHSRVERRAGRWRLSSFDVLWERDVLRPLDPSAPVPVPAQDLARFRPSYRFLAYIQDSRGYRVRDDLPGDDRPEILIAFYADADAWRDATD